MSTLKIQNVRLSFPDLFEARAFKAGDVPKYKATFLVKKGSAEAKAIDAEILAVATAKWGKKAVAILDSIKGNANRFCYQDGDLKEYDGYEGNMALSSNNKSRPRVIDRDTTPLTAEDGKPYAGCYVNASVEFFTYDTPGNGISASLRWVQFNRDGDSFGGGVPVNEDEFDDLGDQGDDDMV